MKHFKLTEETRTNEFGKTLFRIECTADCKWAKVGDKGGWVESEDNIQGNNAWVADEAVVRDQAVVKDNALVCGRAVVRGHATIQDHAVVRDRAVVDNKAIIKDYAVVSDEAFVFEKATIRDMAEVRGSAEVGGAAEVDKFAVVENTAILGCYARVSGFADYCCFLSFGSRNDNTTAYKDKSGEVIVRCGCFNGTLADFEAKVEETHGDNIFGKTYKAIIEVIKLRFGK